MARTITFSGNTLRQYILGIGEHEDRTEYDKYREAYYHQGSPGVRAQRAMMQESPNNIPVPFTIPSARYTDQYYLPHERNKKPAGVSPEEWEEQIAPPNYIINGGLSMGGHVKSDTLMISWINFTTGISIGNCTFGGSIYIQFFRSSSFIAFNNCSFNGPINLMTIEATKVSFFNCNFNGHPFKLQNCIIEQLLFTSCANLSIDIENDKVSYINLIDKTEHKLGGISLSNVTNIEKIAVSGQRIGKTTFKNVTCKEAEFDVKIDGFQLINELNDNGAITPITLKKLNGVIDDQAKFISLFENVTIQDLSLTGTLKDSTLLLVGLTVDKIKIHDFINEGKFRLNDVRLSANGEGELIRCQFGKAELNYVDFSQASRFRVYLSNITELITSNAVFPGNIQGKDEHDLEGIREIYRQLKNAAGKQGDRVNELRYEAAEMRIFENLLSTRKLGPDQWILRLNRWSNGHGQDWIRAGIILIVGSTILFCLIKLSLGYLQPDKSLIFSTVAEFLNFALNPLHKFTDIFEKSPSPVFTGLAQLIDTVARLFSGFMIFQFLRAFRKYVR